MPKYCISNRFAGLVTAALNNLSSGKCLFSFNKNRKFEFLKNISNNADKAARISTEIIACGNGRQ